MWFPYAVLTAVLSAISTIYSKHVLKGVNASVLTLAYATLSLPLIFIFAVIDGIPTIHPVFYLALIGSGGFYVISKNLSLSAIKSSQLSQVIPLTSIGVLATYIFGLLILSEQINSLGISGLLLISVGAYLLNADKIKGNLLTPFKVLITHRSSRLYILGTLIGSIIASFDKISLNNMFPTNPALLLFAQNILITPIAFMLIKHLKIDWKTQFKQNMGKLTIASYIYAFFVLAAFYGFSKGPIAFTVGILNTRVLIVFLLSYIFFKDKPTRFTLLGTLIMIFGVILIKSA